jgi:hypothetical protein
MFYRTLDQLSYCYYTCALNILGTRIEDPVPVSQIGLQLAVSELY